MRLIILGASGLIGGQLYRDAMAASRKVIGTYGRNARDGMRPFDITKDSLNDKLGQIGPEDIVFLMAARIDMNWVKDNPEESRAINIDGAKRIIDKVNAAGAIILYISSEAIFDGVDGGYVETSLPHPLTLYGRQKLEIENYIKDASKDWCIVRTGWTVGRDNFGHNPISATYHTLKRPGAKMAEDNIFTITDVRDTSRAILKLMNQNKRGLYHVASNPPVCRTELADWIMDSSKHRALMNYETVQFKDLTFSEPRPAKSWISNKKLVKEIDQSFIPPRQIAEEIVAQIEADIEEPERTSI